MEKKTEYNIWYWVVAFIAVLFIQNLARFPACPPALLVHLLKQPFVRKSPALRKVLFQHPNVPSQVKRTL